MSYLQDLQMEGSTVEHSDSDSGDSWTLLEKIPTGDVAPYLPENPSPSERENIEVHSEKDEDTDGISIISDSDPESSPCDVNYVKLASEENHPAEEDNTPLLASPLSPNINPNNESVRDETDFLGVNVKYKTSYVHRRNPKVSTILDLIMLGTFIITAGMALGHLWSCKNECTTQTSVNKVLSNLYKLQEENAYLRNKLKEITQTTSYQLLQQRNTPNNKLLTKQHRCKKIFEEPVIKNNEAELAVKCVNENQLDKLHDSLETPEHEKEFLKDIDKMKDIYNTNKNWIDAKVKNQFEVIAKWNDAKPESNGGSKSQRQMNLDNHLGPLFIPVDTVHTDTQDTNNKHTNIKKTKRQTNIGKQLGPTYYEIPLNKEADIKDDKTESNVIKTHRRINSEVQLGPRQHTIPHNPESVNSDESVEMVPEKKITYADSLKTDQPLQRIQRSDNDRPSNWNKDHVAKKKHKDNEVSLNLSSFSEDDIKKDDRHIGPKVKHEKKKHDRQKSHKKQKRTNKYEQWEMKRGYLRDFDEFSVTSSNDMLTNNPERKYLNPEFENYINKLIETERNTSKKDLPKITKDNNEKPNKVEKVSLKGEKGKKVKNKATEWYDQRSALRAEARMKLEHELFGDNTPNNAAWYFRRVQKREQCRAQKDNSIFKKLSKRKMNFKMKR